MKELSDKATPTTLSRSRSEYLEKRRLASLSIFKCKNCGAEFEARTKTNRMFCSVSCKSKKQMEVPENHPNWRGESGNTSATHRWIGRIRIKPTNCDWCGSLERKAKDGRSLLFWANLGGDYLRELDDWACLCMNCHWKLDNQVEKLRRARAEDRIDYLRRNM